MTAMAEPIVLRPGRPWAWSVLVPQMLVVSIVLLTVASAARTDEWGWAGGILILGVLVGVIAWRRFRVRLVADAREVLVFNTFRSWHIPWAMIVAFAIRPQRPWRWRAIGVYLDDGTAISAEATMYWTRRRDLLDRCNDLEQMRLSIVGDASRSDDVSGGR